MTQQQTPQHRSPSRNTQQLHIYHHEIIIIIIIIINVCYCGGAITKYAAGPPYSVKSQSQIKPGFHYPSWRPEWTARVDGWPVSITRQHGPCWRARVSTSRVDGPSTRVVETGL